MRVVAFERLSRLAALLRFAYMPLALVALVAAGIHGAADTLDDRILWAADWLDARLDTLLSASTFTDRFVDVIASPERTWFARALALSWELTVDLVIALPLLGYREVEPPPGTRSFASRPTFRSLAKLVFRRPSTLRLTRPIFTGLLALAGACALAQLVQGSVTLALHDPLGSMWAGPFGRITAIAALLGVLFSFGGRAVLRALEHAHDRTERTARTPALRLSRGLLGSAIAAPLAIAALLDATPLLSFLR